MTAPVNFYADFKGLAALKQDAGAQDPKSLREAARQFESLFTQMMLKSMRDAGRAFRSDDPLMGSDQSDFYQEMFDNQMALQLSKGKGLGLADVLVRQLTEAGASNAQGAKESGFGTRDSGFGSGNSEFQIRDSARSYESRIQNPESPSVSRPLPATAIKAPQPEKDPIISKRTLASSPAEFVSQLWPHAETAARELGVDPRMLIAQAALETGWGKSVPCNPDGTCSFNLFGIKAGSRWQGPSVGVNTLEFEDGIAVRRRESFRAYASPADSFRDYATLIKSSPRYAAALGSGSNATAFANALQQGGYATDPNYATKITAIANRLVDLKSDAPRPLASDRRVSTESGGET